MKNPPGADRIRRDVPDESQVSRVALKTRASLAPTIYCPEAEVERCIAEAHNGRQPL